MRGQKVIDESFSVLLADEGGLQDLFRVVILDESHDDQLIRIDVIKPLDPLETDKSRPQGC